jgi:hypothetical protein
MLTIGETEEENHALHPVPGADEQIIMIQFHFV